jgi:hypothetical protein
MVAHGLWQKQSSTLAHPGAVTRGLVRQVPSSKLPGDDYLRKGKKSVQQCKMRVSSAIG